MEKPQNQNSAITQKSGLPPQAVQNIKMNNSVKSENSYLTLRDIQKNVAKHKLHKNSDNNSQAEVESSNGGLNSQKSVTNIASIRSPADVKELLHYYKNQFVVDSSPDQTDRQKEKDIAQEIKIQDSSEYKTDFKKISNQYDAQSKDDEPELRQEYSAQTQIINDKSKEDKYRSQPWDTDKTMNKKFSPSILKKNSAFQIGQQEDDQKNIIKISNLLRKSNEKQKKSEQTGPRVKWGLNAQQITDDESSHFGEINSGLLSQNQYGIQEQGAKNNLTKLEQELEQFRVQNTSQFQQNDVQINQKMENYFFNKDRKQTSQDFNSSSDFENLRFQKKNVFEYQIKNTQSDFKNTQQELEEFENNLKFSDKKNLDLLKLKQINEEINKGKIDENNQTLTSSYLQTSIENTTNRRKDNDNQFHQISKYQDSVSEKDEAAINNSNQKCFHHYEGQRSPYKNQLEAQQQNQNIDNQDELIISSTHPSNKSPYSGIQQKYLTKDNNDSKISSTSSLKIKEILQIKEKSQQRKSLEIQENNQIQIYQKFANSTQPISQNEKTQKLGQTIQSTIRNIAPDDKINFYQNKKEKQRFQQKNVDQFPQKNQEILQQYQSSQTSVKLEQFVQDQNIKIEQNNQINQNQKIEEYNVEYLQNNYTESQPIQVYQRQEYLHQQPYYNQQLQLNVYDNQESDYMSANHIASIDEQQPYQSQLPESNQNLPFLKTFPNVNYQNHQNQNDLYVDDQFNRLRQIEVPEQNLMVVCYIRRPEQSKNQLQKRKNSASLNRKPKLDSVYQNQSQKSDSSRQFTNRSKSQNNLNRNSKSSKTFDKWQAQNSLHSSNSQDKLLNLKDDQNIKNKQAPQFFTTHQESSQLLFKQYQCEVFVERQNQNSSNIVQDSLISNQLIEATLRNSKDCVRFLAGTYKIANQSLMSAQASYSSAQQLANLRLYNFDRCINDYQQSQQVINESKQFMKAWLLFSKICSTNRESLSSTLQDNFKFVFLFGSSSTDKSEELNLMNKNSVLQDFLNDFPETIRYLQISMFFQDQEFILNDRVFDSTKQSKREIGMEIREALRDRSRLVNKLTQQQPQLALFIQKCSHFRIQINDYIFIDMADLRGLQFFENQEVVQTLTNDFGSMTNEILRQSKFYENHTFQINEEQATSALNQFLRNNISKTSKVLLITFVTNDPEDEVCSTIALDFSHKIHQYYFGMSGDCPIQQIIKDNSHLYNPVVAAEVFSKIQQIFAKLQRIKVRVSSELKKIQRNNHFKFQALMVISFKAVEVVYQKYQQMMNQYKEIINNFYNYELGKIFEDGEHQQFIISKIQVQVEKIDKYLCQLKKSIPADKKNQRISSANDSYQDKKQVQIEFNSRSQKDNISQKKRISKSIPFQVHTKSVESRKSSQQSGYLQQRQAGYKFSKQNQISKQINQQSLQKFAPQNEYIQLNMQGPFINQRKKGLDPESMPITTDSSHNTARKGSSTQGRRKKKQQAQVSSRLAMPKTQTDIIVRSKNKSKQNQKNEGSSQYKLRDRFSETGQVQPTNLYPNQLDYYPQEREQLSKNIDQELQMIKNNKNNQKQQNLRQYDQQQSESEIRKSKINQILNEQSIILQNQNPINFNDKKRKSQIQEFEEQNRKSSFENKKDNQTLKIEYEKSTINSIKNPFLEDDFKQLKLNVKKQETIKSDKLSIDFGNLEVLTNLSQSNLQTKNHNSLTEHQILNQFSQRQDLISQPRTSLHQKQSSDQSKSLNLLDTTTHRNKAYEITQLQNQVQLLKQQLQFQKQELRIETDEEIQRIINEERMQHEVDINQAIKQTRLDVIFKEKEKLRLEVKNEVYELANQEAMKKIELITKQQLKKEVQAEISGKLREELKIQMWQEVQDELRDQLRPQVINEIQNQFREEVKNEIYNSDQFQESENIIKSLQNQLKISQLDLKDVQNRCTENEKIIEQLQKKRQKDIKKNDQNKLFEQKIDQLIHKYEKLKDDKIQLEESNRQMFIQIETIKNQKLVENHERDQFLQELIDKNKQKSEKINEQKEKELRYKEQIRKSDIVIEDLNEKLYELEKKIKLKENALNNNETNQKYDQLKNAFNQLQGKYEILKDELKNKDADNDFVKQEFLQKIEEIKEQKENYRKQLIDKKEEVKQLKDMLNSQISRQKNVYNSNEKKKIQNEEYFDLNIKKMNTGTEIENFSKNKQKQNEHISEKQERSRHRTIDDDNKLDDLSQNIRDGVKSFRQNSIENRANQEKEQICKSKLVPVEVLPPKKPKILGNQSKNTKSGKSILILSSDDDQDEYETDTFVNKKNQIFKKETELLKQKFSQKNTCKERSMERNSPPTKDQIKSTNLLKNKVKMGGKESIKDIRSLIEDYKRDNQQLNQVKNNIIKNNI